MSDVPRGRYAGDRDPRRPVVTPRHGQDATGSADAQACAGHRLRPLAEPGFTSTSPAAMATCSPMNLPMFGRTVIVANPQLAKQVFTASTDDAGNVQPNLSRVLGSGSVFALDGADHRLRRKLLTPPFHGKSIKNYEKIFEEETLRESAELAGGSGIPDPRADDAHHAECHPSRGVRRRR